MEVEAENTPTVDQALEAEITSYKTEQGQEIYKRDEGYNGIWKIAICILAIPATLVPSERVFSAAANIVNKKRAHLKPETLHLLIFCRGNKEFVD
jgi:hypothetical protein